MNFEGTLLLVFLAGTIWNLILSCNWIYSRRSDGALPADCNLTAEKVIQIWNRMRKYLISVEFSISESVRNERCVWLKQCRSDKRWNEALSNCSVSDRPESGFMTLIFVLFCWARQSALSKNLSTGLFDKKTSQFLCLKLTCLSSCPVNYQTWTGLTTLYR